MSITVKPEIKTGSSQANRAASLARFAWPAGIFLLALLPRVIDLGRRPFWLDEMFTLQRASLQPGALMVNSFQNHHMPSFFLMLAPLTHFGDPQFWLRLPSALFGAAAVMLVYLIAARIAGRLAGVLAALVLGFSPMALAFAQEARSYTMEMTLILVALYGVTRLTLDLPAASRNWRQAKAGWLCFVLGTVAALDVLGDALPWWLAANLIFLCLLGFSDHRRGLLRNLALADAAILALTAPFYLVMLHFQTESVTNALGWIPPLDAARLWYSLGSVYFMHVADWVSFRFISRDATPGVIWLIDAALLATLCVAAWKLRRRPAVMAMLAVALLFLPVLFVLISLKHPIFLPRYLLWSAAPFAILAGIGGAALLDRRAPGVAWAAVVGAGALLLVNALPYYAAETKPRWDVAAQILANDVAPGDMLYLSDDGALPILQHYLPADARATVLAHAGGDLAQAQQAVASGKRVWVVYGHAGQNTGTAKEFFAKTKTLGEPSVVEGAGRRIAIVLYDPASHLAFCTQLGMKDGICS
ncbi:MULTISPECIES: glycosyltransferase family 39 protein [unclassified Acidocella]|uniref:glycosyltransferase family 39 protein n=1 Tax=unclassified Acidocella TaxID=2648610 RepID=UPI00028EE1B8|nr:MULTISPECIES: glycosyltransferase family 39 protein [unclassified Acidocella]EKN01154.1 hypothetical protein MXAZACID_01819 [Acidocella sp. MX-AZ02]WBO60680.1 glycosyltransferase family 39 protein [Acidocella sp. MX-AZ03]